MTTERELRARARICYAEVEEDEVDEGDINGKEGRQKGIRKKHHKKMKDGKE